MSKYYINGHEVTWKVFNAMSWTTLVNGYRKTETYTIDALDESPCHYMVFVVLEKVQPWGVTDSVQLSHGF